MSVSAAMRINYDGTFNNKLNLRITIYQELPRVTIIYMPHIAP